LVINVCNPASAVNIPLFVIPLLNEGVIAALSVQLAPEFMVTKPINVFAGLVAEEKVNTPDTPPPTVVVPVTVKAKPPAVNVVPSPIERLPETVVAIPVVVAELPLVLT
jgi:hypothetical protein